MSGQALRGESGIPITHCLKESFVFGERDFRRIHVFECHGVHGEEEDALDVGTETGEEVLEATIAGRGTKGGVEFDVELELASNVAFVIRMAHPGNDCLERREALRLRIAGEDVHGERLEGFPDGVDFANVVGLERGNDNAPTLRGIDDQAVLLELKDRLANGRFTDLELLGKVGFDNALARREIA